MVGGASIMLTRNAAVTAFSNTGIKETWASSLFVMILASFITTQSGNQCRLVAKAPKNSALQTTVKKFCSFRNMVLPGFQRLWRDCRMENIATTGPQKNDSFSVEGVGIFCTTVYDSEEEEGPRDAYNCTYNKGISHCWDVSLWVVESL